MGGWRKICSGREKSLEHFKRIAYYSIYIHIIIYIIYLMANTLYPTCLLLLTPIQSHDILFIFSLIGMGFWT